MKNRHDIQLFRPFFSTKKQNRKLLGLPAQCVVGPTIFIALAAVAYSTELISSDYVHNCFFSFLARKSYNSVRMFSKLFSKLTNFDKLFCLLKIDFLSCARCFRDVPHVAPWYRNGTQALSLPLSRCQGCRGR